MYLKSKAMRKLIAGSLAAVMLSSGFALLPMAGGNTGISITARAEDNNFVVNDFSYVVISGQGENKVKVTNYTGTGTDITIPETVKYESVTYTVTVIGSSFGKANLKSIELPSSIETIESGAFELCTGLDYLTLPEELEYFGNLFGNSLPASFTNLNIYEGSVFQKMTGSGGTEIPFFADGNHPQKTVVLKSKSRELPVIGGTDIENISLKGQPLGNDYTGTYYIQNGVNISDDFKSKNGNYCSIVLDKTNRQAKVSNPKRSTHPLTVAPAGDETITIDGVNYTIVHSFFKVDKVNSTCIAKGMAEHYEDEAGNCYKYEDSSYVALTQDEVDALVLPLAAHDYDESGVCKVCKAAFNNGIGGVTGHSLNLDTTIGVNFYMGFTDEYFSNYKDTAYVLFTVKAADGSEKTEKVTLKDAEYKYTDKETQTEKTAYRFQCHVCAKEMNDKITGKLYNSDGVESALKEFTYSVREYGDQVVNNYYDYDVSLVKLCDAMLTYGRYAQQYFNYGDQSGLYSISDAARTYLSSNDAASRISGVNSEYVNNLIKGGSTSFTNGANSGIEFCGTSLSLQSEIVLRLYFAVDSAVVTNAGNIVVKINNTVSDLKLESNGTYYYLEVTGSASELDKVKSIKLYPDNTSTDCTEVNYGVLSYASLALSRQTTATRTEALKDLIRSMCIYIEFASVYFA